jgi:hypothetical protein
VSRSCLQDGAGYCKTCSAVIHRIELLLTGAAAGTAVGASCCVSCPNTWHTLIHSCTAASLLLQTHEAAAATAAGSATALSNQGLQGSVVQFWQTGNRLVAQRGPAVLFTGLWPRLVHQVPGMFFSVCCLPVPLISQQGVDLPCAWYSQNRMKV